jgi:hypothetical protein
MKGSSESGSSVDRGFFCDWPLPARRLDVDIDRGRNKNRTQRDGQNLRRYGRCCEETVKSIECFDQKPSWRSGRSNIV